MIIGNLFWGFILFFILCPLGLFLLFTIPGYIIEDIGLGLTHMKNLEILKGLAILLRPIWITLILGVSLVLIGCSEELGNKIVRWFNDR